VLKIHDFPAVMRLLVLGPLALLADRHIAQAHCNSTT
jgi:hypothetical protein